MIIKVNNIDKIKLKDSKTSLYGDTSQIYTFGKNYYFKLLNKSKFLYNGYQDLRNPFNVHLYNMVLELSKLEDVPFYNKPIYIYRSHELFYGYVTLRINGKSLNRLDDDIEVSNLFNSVNLLRETVMNICNNGIIPNDIYGRNILYDGRLILIDLDYSYHNAFIGPNEAYVNTMYDILMSIKNLLLTKLWDNVNYPILEDIEIIRGINRKLYLDDYTLIRLEKDYKDGSLDDFSIYFDRLIELVNNSSDSEIRTLGELKRNLIVKK